MGIDEEPGKSSIVDKDFDVDQEDARFTALSSSKFSIDTSSRAFRKTVGMEKLSKKQVQDRILSRKRREEKLAMKKEEGAVDMSDEESDLLLRKLKRVKK